MVSKHSISFYRKDLASQFSRMFLSKENRRVTKIQRAESVKTCQRHNAKGTTPMALPRCHGVFFPTGGTLWEIVKDSPTEISTCRFNVCSNV